MHSGEKINPTLQPSLVMPGRGLNWDMQYTVIIVCYLERFNLSLEYSVSVSGIETGTNYAYMHCYYLKAQSK